jgi:PAT family beta-lactamase induction signal transducer AmpG
LLAFLTVFRSRRMAVLALLGFSSGLPLLITSQLLGARLADEGLSIDAIATFSLVGLAYTLKWAWAPLVDRYALPSLGLGRRRGWLMGTQLALAGSLVLLGALDPARQLPAFALAAALVAFVSATQDIVVDAYRTDLLAPDERAAGAAAYFLGYRAAMVVSGTLALGAADLVSWPMVTYGLAALSLVGVVGTLLASEPPAPEPGGPLLRAIVDPWLGLLRLPRAWLILAFVALYKFGDHLALALVVPFLKRGAGFDNATIAIVHRGIGYAGALAGGVVAGALVARLHDVRRVLVPFGALQAAANLGYALLAAAPTLPLFVGVVLVDEVANAMGTAAFMAFLMSLCDRRVSATQYALLSALSSVGQRLFGVTGGPIVEAVGWSGFFAVTAAVALPGLLLVPALSRTRSSPAATP